MGHVAGIDFGRKMDEGNAAMDRFWSGENSGKSQNETHTVSMSFPEETIEQLMPFVAPRTGPFTPNVSVEGTEVLTGTFIHRIWQNVHKSMT
jgi:hypothetical protein